MHPWHLNIYFTVTIAQSMAIIEDLTGKIYTGQNNKFTPYVLLPIWGSTYKLLSYIALLKSLIILLNW